MSTQKEGRVELGLLALFKWAVVTSMVVLIGATLVLLATGGIHMTGTPLPAEPARKATQPKFSTAEFAKSLGPDEQKEAAAEEIASPQPTLAEDASEAMFRAQLDKLWAHLQQYQKACRGSSSGLDKDAFVETIHQSPLKHILETRGQAYAASQDAFMGTALTDPQVVKFCKSGKQGIFIGALEFHRASWDRQVEAAKAFEDAENSRVSAFDASEARRIEDRRAFAIRAFIGAAIAFGLFMSVALVLIFARIESNLRGISMNRLPTEQN